MNDNSLIRVAYQNLLDTFKGGNIESLLFTSFNFSASFFENNVLPLAAGCSIDEASSMQSSQVNELLENTQITVVCDRSTSPEPKGNYRYGQLAVGLKSAFFHPKIILATGRLEDNTPMAVLMAGSCNLTLSGWGLNREVVGACVVGVQQAENLLPLIVWISNIAKNEMDLLKGNDDDTEEGSIRDNLASIEKFLTDNCNEVISSNPNFLIRLPGTNVDKTYLQLLMSEINTPIDTCKIVSPFWSNRKGLQPLLEKINSNYIDFVPSINKSGKYCFPLDMRDFLKESTIPNGYKTFKNNDRYTHAKSLSLNSGNLVHWFIGSANFTKAAMGSMAQGNVEAMLHYQLNNAKQIDSSFRPLLEEDIDWADDSEAEEDCPKVSPYLTHAAYNWKTKAFNCVLECSNEAFNCIKDASYNQKSLDFIQQNDGRYLATLSLSVKQPVYTIDLSYLDNGESGVYQGLVSQWNAEGDELSYSPKPKLSTIMDDLRALDPTKGPKRGRQGKGESSEPDETETAEEDRVFDFFSIYQAFYKQREYFSKHPDKDPLRRSTVFSIPLIFRAISLEIESKRSNFGELSKDDLIYYFIFLSELSSTAKELTENSRADDAAKLIGEIEVVVAELDTPFKKLMGESAVLKQFLHTDSVDKKSIDSILGWFKEEVDFSHG
jgi:hypothetical protein